MYIKRKSGAVGYLEAFSLCAFGLNLVVCCSENRYEPQPINWRAQHAETIVYAEVLIYVAFKSLKIHSSGSDLKLIFIAKAA